jgi:tetratricopeptide (TPR) repeat protein
MFKGIAGRSGGLDRGWLPRIDFGSLALLLLITCTVVKAQLAPSPRSDESSMRQHYDAAYRFQSSGDFARADAEHVSFLVAALQHVANIYANTGDYSHAVPAYDEAFTLAPGDFSLLLDYGGAALDAHDPKKAKSLLQTALDLDAKTTTSQQRAEARRVLGGALRALGDSKSSLDQYRAAISLDPNIENMCALGDAQLELDSHQAAAATFAKVVARFGDTAAVRMRIGRVYGLAGIPDRAIEEFQKAVAKDDKMLDVHYSLGAAYMSNSVKDLPRAETEFRREIALHPNDIFSYPQLGQIALRRHDYRVAEADYKRAITLNPLDVDNYMQLGKLYMETNRPSDAEVAFRKAIALTVDPARNYFEIERAHYRLGQLLMAGGNTTEGEQELQISQDLLTKREIQSGSKLSGEDVERNPLERTKVATPAEAEELKTFSKQATPLIAGSYNNLGVHAAMKQDFVRAAGYFQLAAKWEPTLSGVDGNWGRAAFAAHECEQALGPLRRSLDAHPADGEFRAMLEQCQGTPSTAGKP